MRNGKVKVTKELRDEIINKVNDNIEVNIQERGIICDIIDSIDTSIDSYNEDLKNARKRYRLDRKASNRALRREIKKEKQIHQNQIKSLKKEHQKELRELYRPVEVEQAHIFNSEEEKKEYNERLEEIRKEIKKLQEYKAFIDMKYTSDKNRKKFIDQSLIPRDLRTK